MRSKEELPEDVERVWEYPRPPRLERTTQRLMVEHGGVPVAATTRGLRVLETSHPPVYYIPPEDAVLAYLQRSVQRSSFCEFKGVAQYWDLALPGKARVSAVAWSYARPAKAYAELKDCLAFYASRVDACFVDGERVTAQAGDFYGGWITSQVRGPFKGEAGTRGW